MNTKRFIVVFTNHCYEEVNAFGRSGAIILAQAEQIKKGNSYSVAFVKNEKGTVI